MNKKNLFLWSLYDFANSIVFINFLLYFSQWLVVDRGFSDFWYNAIFAITTILLLFSAPSLAALTDRHGGRKYFLNIATVGTFVSYGLAALLATLGSGHVFVAAILFLIGQYFYQLSFVFYNPMLYDIADAEHRGRASGIGQFSNSLGQVMGLVITLPLAASRVAPLLPSVGIFFVLALPMMIFFKESRLRERVIGLEKIKAESRAYKKKLVAFFAFSAATPMLVAFFFFNDALVTLSSNYSIYMERVFEVPDTTKSIMLISVLAMSALGGIIAGWLGDKIGNIQTLKGILVGWVIALPIVALAPNMLTLAIITAVVGLLLGSVWAVTRAHLATLLSKDDMGYGFSFYTLAERFATFIGPLTWGGIIALLGTGASSYRIAMATMVLFIIVGLAILSLWQREVGNGKGKIC